MKRQGRIVKYDIEITDFIFDGGVDGRSIQIMKKRFGKLTGRLRWSIEKLERMGVIKRTGFGAISVFHIDVGYFTGMSYEEITCTKCGWKKMIYDPNQTHANCSNPKCKMPSGQPSVFFIRTNKRMKDFKGAFQRV